FAAIVSAAPKCCSGSRPAGFKTASRKFSASTDPILNRLRPDQPAGLAEPAARLLPGSRGGQELHGAPRSVIQRAWRLGQPCFVAPIMASARGQQFPFHRVGPVVLSRLVLSDQAFLRRQFSPLLES